MDAVRVPPSACSTSQSMHDGVLADRLEVHAGPQAAADQPGDLVGTAADAPLTDSRSERVLVDRGSIAYSQVTQPRPEPLRQRGTPSVTLAVHSTRVCAELDQHRALGVDAPVAGDRRRVAARRLHVHRVGPCPPAYRPAILASGAGRPTRPGVRKRPVVPALSGAPSLTSRRRLGVVEGGRRLRPGTVAVAMRTARACRWSWRRGWRRSRLGGRCGRRPVAERRRRAGGAAAAGLTPCGDRRGPRPLEPAASGGRLSMIAAVVLVGEHRRPVVRLDLLVELVAARTAGRRRSDRPALAAPR